jgi:signal transduction histidine kinase
VVRIIITDTGVGMTPKELDIALSRFGQVDSGLNRKHEGTGLGLPLTLGLVEAMGGHCDIQTTKGGGTMVCLTFQAQSAPTLPQAAISAL